MRKQTDHRQQIHKDYDVLARRKESSILVGLPFLYVLTNNNFNKLKIFIVVLRRDTISTPHKYKKIVIIV